MYDRREILSDVIHHSDRIKSLINEYDVIKGDLDVKEEKCKNKFNNSEYYSKHLITCKACSVPKQIIQEVLMVLLLYLSSLQPGDELRKYIDLAAVHPSWVLNYTLISYQRIEERRDQ